MDRLQEKVLGLSVPERIQLLEDLWDSIALYPSQLELTGGQARELDRRLQEHRKNPDKGRSWDQVKKRMKKASHHGLRNHH